MVQITISGDEIIDLNELLDNVSIGVGDGLDISGDIISIKQDTLSSLIGQKNVEDLRVSHILSTNFINKTSRKDSFVNYQEISGIDISLGENMIVYNDTLLTNYEYYSVENQVDNYFNNTINLYSFDGNEWTFDSSNNLRAYLTTATATSPLKASYSIDSNFIAIGNNTINSNQGKVTIYRGNRFSDPSQDINGSINNDQFGKYVSLSNNKIAIGSDSKIFIYEYSGTSWTETDISYNVSGYDLLSLNHNILSYTDEINGYIYIHDISSNIDISLNVNASSLVSNKDGTIMAYSVISSSKVYVIRSPNWNNVSAETFDAPNAKISLSDDGQILSFSSNGVLNIYQHMASTWTYMMNELTEYENSRSIKISNDSKKIFLEYSDNIRVYNIYPLTNNLIDEVDDLKIKIPDLSLNVRDTINSFNDLSLNANNSTKNMNIKLEDLQIKATEEYGFCVCCSNNVVSITNDIIPFDKKTGKSGENSSGIELFSVPSGSFDTTTYEYEVAQSGKYLVGFNLYINDDTNWSTTTSYTQIHKNGIILMSSEDMKRNERAQVVNHFVEGDKISLVVVGTNEIIGYNSSFYAYLIHRTDNNYTLEKTNVNINSINIEGNTDISGVLTTNSLDISGDINCVDLTVNGTINASNLIKYNFYGFQVSYDISMNNEYNINTIFPFELTSNVNDFCLPTNIDFSNNVYTVPVNGVYKFSYELFISTLETPSGSKSGTVSIMKNDVSILDSGKFMITSNRGSCISQCSVGDTISIKHTSTSTNIKIIVNMSLSTFSGYLIQAT